MRSIEEPRLTPEYVATLVKDYPSSLRKVIRWMAYTYPTESLSLDFVSSVLKRVFYPRA